MELMSYLFDKLEFFLALFCTIWIFKIGRVGMSMLIVTGTVLFKNIIDQLVVIDYHSSAPSGDAGIAIWYVMFTFTNLSVVTIIYILHKVAPARLCFTARCYIAYCTASAILQVVRCSERLYFETNLIKPFYTYGVPIMNYCFMAVLLVGLYQLNQRSKEFEERIAWNI